MGSVKSGRSTCALVVVLVVITSEFAQAQKFPPFIFPEQRTIQVRDPSELPKARIPHTPPPPTVWDDPADGPLRFLSLDEAIRTALANAQVVRVLSGVAASSSGRTIYDVAVDNNAIDKQQATFDPKVDIKNSFNRAERPSAAFPLPQPHIEGDRRDNYNLDVDVSKKTVSGGTVNLGVNAAPERAPANIFQFQPEDSLLLNPANRSSLELSYTQPLLQGGGMRANLAPIVLARIDTERSYFQFKDSVQELVRGVIDAYWAIVFARTDVWARSQQVEQAEEAYQRARAELQVGRASLADVAQAHVALSNFRANLITAQADLLGREAALRNLLGFPPYDSEQIIPVTPPRKERFAVDWHTLLELAEEQRPDIVELKLVLEADQQRLLQARNGALPQVNAVALYRWNGLEGETRGGLDLSSQPGQFTDWTLAVNFSVPLGLRQERANLRQQELIIARDRANLEQGMHNAAHVLAGNLRNLAQFYRQYEAFKETREAAMINVQEQFARYRTQIRKEVVFLNVLQAITDWGNAVSAEARALLQYNTELANLERQTGTILETHGIRFLEERFGSIGPLGRLHPDPWYPSALRPTLNADRYPSGEGPAEDSFDLESPIEPRGGRLPRGSEEIPRPRPAAPGAQPPSRQGGPQGSSSLGQFID